MDSQFSSKNLLGIFFLLFVAMACKAPIVSDPNPPPQSHLNPISQIFTKLGIELPSTPPGQSTLSLKERKSLRREVVTNARKALKMDRADGLVDPGYDIGDPPVKDEVMYVCKGGVCPCQVSGGSNKFVFVEAMNRFATGGGFKFNKMTLITDGQRIELPVENVRVNNHIYQSFTLDVSTFTTFAPGTLLEISYRLGTSERTSLYEFKVTYNRPAPGIISGDGMIISKL